MPITFTDKMKLSKTKHPQQPIGLDDQGVARFKENKIVRFLLDAGPYDMNKLACMPFDKVDREQFAQLIGYSVCGFNELSYASDASCEAANEKVEEIIKVKKK